MIRSISRAATVAVATKLANAEKQSGVGPMLGRTSPVPASTYLPGRLKFKHQYFTTTEIFVKAGHYSFMPWINNGTLNIRIIQQQNSADWTVHN